MVQASSQSIMKCFDMHRAALQSSTHALFALGKHYKRGTLRLDVDMATSFTLVSLAAAKGFRDAQANVIADPALLAFCLLFAIGVAPAPEAEGEDSDADDDIPDLVENFEEATIV